MKLAQRSKKYQLITVLVATILPTFFIALSVTIITFIPTLSSPLAVIVVIFADTLLTLLAWLLLAMLSLRSQKAGQTTPNADPLNLETVQQQAPHTGTYGAALIAIASPVPVIAALTSIASFLLLSSLPYSNLVAPVSGTTLTLLLWLIIALPYRRLTAVDFANPSTYELLLNRLAQFESWFAVLQPEPDPQGNSVYAISKQEVRSSCDKIYDGLTKKSASWMLATGYVNLWRLMHRVDEAFVNIEPVEAVIQGALHDEMSLQNSTLKNKEDLLKKLRVAVKTLDKRAATYLNQQPPQENHVDTEDAESSQNTPVQAKLFPEQPQNQNVENLEKHAETFSNDINMKTQARTVIRDIRLILHQFRDDRWEKLVRVRNHLIRMTLFTGVLLYALLEFAIISGIDRSMLKGVTVYYLVGAIVGLFGRLYDQAKSDTSIDDFRLAAARLVAAPLYSGLAAIGGVVVVQRAIAASVTFDINVANILIAAAFGLTPSLFTNAIQKEAEQYKSDIQSTTAPATEKGKTSA